MLGGYPSNGLVVVGMESSAPANALDRGAFWASNEYDGPGDFWTVLGDGFTGLLDTLGDAGGFVPREEVAEGIGEGEATGRCGAVGLFELGLLELGLLALVPLLFELDDAGRLMTNTVSHAEQRILFPSSSGGTLSFFLHFGHEMVWATNYSIGNDVPIERTVGSCSRNRRN